MASYAKLVHSDAEIFIAPIGVSINRDALIASQELYFLAYSDIQQETVRVIDMGDGWVLTENVWTGTNDGPYFGIPATGNSIELRGAALSRYDADGLMTNMNVYWDGLTSLMQLGLIPPPEVPPEGYDNVFFMSLEEGLNMISLPLKPITPYTARSFAEMLFATVVIELDEARQRFVGFTLDAPDDGFAIEGGKGYIVNVPEDRVVALTGAAWTNQPPVEEAPPLTIDSANSAWAFVVIGRLSEAKSRTIRTAADTDKTNGYLVTIRNTRTNAIATDVLRQGYFAAAFADLTRQSVVKAGDRLEVTVMDRSGEIASEKIPITVTEESLRQAFLPIILTGVGKPDHSLLLQNYPNPFNPETWIPYQLREPADVAIHIYDSTGRLVRTLSLGRRSAGFYRSRARAAYWDGKNDSGEHVASGVYFYQLRADDFSATRRMLITK